MADKTTAGIQNDAGALASLRQYLHEPGQEPEPRRRAARLMRVKLADLAEFLRAHPTYRVVGL